MVASAIKSYCHDVGCTCLNYNCLCRGKKKACIKQAIIIKRSYNNDFMNVGVESQASKILLRRI